MAQRKVQGGCPVFSPQERSLLDRSVSVFEIPLRVAIGRCSTAGCRRDSLSAHEAARASIGRGQKIAAGRHVVERLPGVGPP